VAIAAYGTWFGAFVTVYSFRIARYKFTYLLTTLRLVANAIAEHIDR